MGLVIGGHISIEVETGYAFPKSNVKKDLAHGFQKIIIACQTKMQVSKFKDRWKNEFPNETRVMIVDIAYFLKMKKEELL